VVEQAADRGSEELLGRARLRVLGGVIMTERRMNEGQTPALHSIGAVIATLFGVASFFAIIGVFGLSTSIATLVLFVALAVFIFRLPQDQGTRP
jgi:hypothetical protein